MARIEISGFSVDAAGNTTSTQVEVRTKANALATLYAAETGATEAYAGANPFTSGTGTPDKVGAFTFWIDEGSYKITTGVGASATTRPMEAIAAPKPFATRAALVAYWSDGKDPDGTILSDGTVQYVANAGATSISDLAGLLPFGDVSPEHFGANTTPGTTDMTTAIQAAVDYVKADNGGIVFFLPTFYLISAPIEIDSNGIFLMGKGKLATVITQGTTNTNAIYVSSDAGGDDYRRYTGIYDMTIQQLNGDQTAGALIRAERPRDLHVHRCALLGGWDGIQVLSGNTVSIADCLINYQGFTSQPSGNAGIKFDRLQTTSTDPNGVQDSADSLYYAVGYVYMVSDCEIWGAGDYGRVSGILVRQCDGLQVSNTHIGRASQGQVTFKAAQSNLIVQNVNFSNCQFDPAGESLVGTSNYGVWLEPDGLSGRLLRDITFSNCSVLGAEVDGVRIAEAVGNFQWFGGFIKLCGAWGVRVNNTNVESVRFIGLTSRDANQDALGSGHFLVNAGEASFIGCEGYGAGAIGVTVASGATAYLEGNRFPDAGTVYSIAGTLAPLRSGPAIHRGYVRTEAVTVATLPAAATAGAGARHFVTDATATTFNSIVAGGGANAVPVCSDGTNWRIGG